MTGGRVPAARLRPWLGELLRLGPDLARSYLPVAPLDPRRREAVILAVAEVHDCPASAWVHGAWRDVLGAGPFADWPGDTDDAVLAFARACAEAGHPIDPGALGVALPAATLRALRAHVAGAELESVVGTAADRLRSRRSPDPGRAPLAAVTEAVTLALAAPLAVPYLAVGGLLQLVKRLAPDLPELERPDPDEANLLVHLLADAVPGCLGNAVVRTVVLSLPFPVSIGVRSGRTAATVRVARGRVTLSNGLRDDVIVLLEGDLEPLLRAASGAILRELRSIRIRPL